MGADDNQPMIPPIPPPMPARPSSGPDAVPGEPVFRIRRDGVWTYHGSVIQRPALVRLFATTLRRDAARDYWLVTPAERHRIIVDDVPFLAVDVQVHGRGTDQALDFRTNLDDGVAAGPDHAIRVVGNGGNDDKTGGTPGNGENRGPVPYLNVRDGLDARIARPVYYRLVDLAVPRESGNITRIGIWSRGIFFTLGEMPPS